MSQIRDAPAFDFYPERWLVGVAGMSDAEQLAYLRLLCHQWLLQGLPEDVHALKRLGGKGVTPAVLAKLPLHADGRRRNARLEIIREEQRERIAKSRDKISRMNAARAAGRAAPPKGGKAPPRDARAGLLQEDLQDALQGGRGELLAGELREDREAVRQDDLGGALQEGRGERLDGFLTAHHPPPTSEVPEDANNAGGREADAAGDAAAPADADAEAAAMAAADAAADAAAAAERAAARKAAAARAANDAAGEATPSLATVQAWAVGIGCPPDKAEIWWHEHEARPQSFFGRWTDRDGNAVQRPQHALTAWWRKWQANDHQRNTRNHPTTPYHANTRPTPARSDSANAPGRYA